MPRILTRGSGLSILMVVIAAAAMVWVTSAALPRRSAAHTRSSATPLVSRLTPEPGELRMALAKAALTPDYIAAVGANAETTTVMVSAGRSYLTDHPGAISAPDGDFMAAQAEHDRLVRVVQQGQATESDTLALQTARATLVARRADLQNALGSFRSAAAAGFNESQTAALTVLRANAQWEVPMQYKVVNRPVAGWVALRNALANDRISRRHGEDPDAQGQAIVGQANAEPATVTAAANLAANLAQVNAAYEAAIRR